MKYQLLNWLTTSEDVPANVLLEKFGEMFLEFCQDSGYDRILKVLGATPRDFLQVISKNPNHFFLLIELSVPQSM